MTTKLCGLMNLMTETLKKFIEVGFITENKGNRDIQDEILTIVIKVNDKVKETYRVSRIPREN